MTETTKGRFLRGSGTELWVFSIKVNPAKRDIQRENLFGSGKK